MLTAAACSQNPAVIPTDSGILFQDDFASVTSGWDRHAGAEATIDYLNGQYQITVNEPGVEVWATPGLELPEAAVEVDTTLSAGPSNSEFGLICRYYRSGDAVNFYFFVITGEGKYGAGKVIRNQRRFLTPGGGFQPASAILLGAGKLNHIAAVCHNQHFEFAVNSQPVAQFDDDSLARGGPGLIAGTFEAAGAQATFDNFSARRP